MPHLSVKIYSGRSEAEKRRLADCLTQAVADVLRHGEAATSVAIFDVEPSDWMDRVYEQEIRAHADQLYKRPGYGPLAE